MELANKTAVVTGASRNIGRAISAKMAEHGADVGVTARQDIEGVEKTAELVRQEGCDSTVSLADLGNPEQVRTMVSDIRNELGSIDILVNNATYRPEKPFLDIEISDINRVMNINFRGLLLTAQEVAPDMIDQGEGAIVNLIGAMVYLGRPDHVHSYGTKFAIEGQTRQLATELGEDGIRVNAVSPGLIDVGRESTEEWVETKQRIIQSTPLCRMGNVDEIAEVCTFLSSERASFITGQVIHANGGTYPTPTIVPTE